ncbi:hypothetical protein CC79DRAFT_1363805 [Sarocladium strictum]
MGPCWTWRSDPLPRKTETINMCFGGSRRSARYSGGMGGGRMHGGPMGPRPVVKEVHHHHGGGMGGGRMGGGGMFGGGRRMGGGGGMMGGGRRNRMSRF